MAVGNAVPIDGNEQNNLLLVCCFVVPFLDFVQLASNMSSTRGCIYVNASLAL